MKYPKLQQKWIKWIERNSCGNGNGAHKEHWKNHYEADRALRRCLEELGMWELVEAYDEEMKKWQKFPPK